MRVLSRDFTKMEKVMLVILVLILIGFAYYQFIDKPVRTGLTAAEAETSALQVELNAVRSRINTLQRMKDEIEDITSGSLNSYMLSYNGSKVELQFLNDVLSETTQYSISFNSVTRSGDQIRRNFSLQFTVPAYEDVKNIITKLTGVDYRCLIGDLSFKEVTNRTRDLQVVAYSVSCTATFFETMVGGTADAGLPSDSTAK